MKQWKDKSKFPVLDREHILMLLTETNYFLVNVHHKKLEHAIRIMKLTSNSK